MKCLLCNKDTRYIIARRLRGGEKKNVYYCKRCEIAMLDEVSSERKLKKFYSNEYRKKFTPKLNKISTSRELFDIYSNFQENRVSLIKGFLNKKMRLLEVGCSAGMFLFHIKKYVREVVGIDYDSKAAHFASKKCSCQVFDSDIEKTGLAEQTFDVICMFQLLEHAKNPYELLEKFKKYLKPKGIMYVEVPNLHDALIYAYNLPNHYNFYFHSAHRTYFTAKSLNNLMKKTNFDGQVAFTQDYNILNHLHWISVDAPQPDCLPGLSPPVLPLRGSLGAHKRKELNSFITKMNFEYKELLAKLGVASNISFIGRQK